MLATRDFTGGDGDGPVRRTARTWRRSSPASAGKTADTRDYRGIAPGAYLLNLRVLGDDGSGSASDVIEAIDWTIEHRREYNVRIINLSLGRAGAAAVSRRSAVRGGRAARCARASSSWSRRATTGGRRTGRTCSGAITTPGNSPYRDHGGGDRHARDGEAVGRHAGAATARRGRRATT
mgnify:CR=1 FL=1